MENSDAKPILSKEELESINKAFLSLPPRVRNGDQKAINAYWDSVASGSILLPPEVDALNGRCFDYLLNHLLSGSK